MNEALSRMVANQRAPVGRGIFCNRTLNLRGIKAIGYDMDYTLIHYNEVEWEQRAFTYLKEKLIELGWPVHQASFDPRATIRGLIIDKELGNLVKANRFGYIKQAAHGQQLMSYEEQRRVYSRTVVDLAEPRWVFLNTLFSLSEASMYAFLVDQQDQQRLPEVLGYAELYDRTKACLDEAHMEGRLKAEIIADPDRFIDLDPDGPLALLDQKAAGKKLLLITNSGWAYTNSMMAWAYDRFLPDGTSWRDLFDLVIVSARKPAFFEQQHPAFKVVDLERGLLEPCMSGYDRDHRFYWGGDALKVEQFLGFGGADVLYVGDHIYGDVHVSKSIRRWRTALILRELEAEFIAQEGFAEKQLQISEMMQQKRELEFRMSQCRLQLLRKKGNYKIEPTAPDRSTLESWLVKLRAEVVALDQQIAPLAIAAGKLYNERWGLLLHTGNDKSHLARQLERHADVYTSRVSNLVFPSPFAYLRSHRGMLPHDR